MSRSSIGGLISSSLLTVILLGIWGCGDEADPADDPGPGASRSVPGPGSAPGTADTGPIGASPTVKQIMGKLTKGPSSLTAVIGTELEADPPAWATIAPQTEEYARLAAAMGKNDPPLGSKESWSKFTTAFATSAEALNKAAQAKNRDAALEAHSAITGSCMDCHKAHRRGGGMMGGPGMGGRGMGRPGGQRPGGGMPKGGPPQG